MQTDAIALGIQDHCNITVLADRLLGLQNLTARTFDPIECHLEIVARGKLDGHATVGARLEAHERIQRAGNSGLQLRKYGTGPVRRASSGMVISSRVL